MRRLSGDDRELNNHFFVVVLDDDSKKRLNSPVFFSDVSVVFVTVVVDSTVEITMSSDASIVVLVVPDFSYFTFALDRLIASLSLSDKSLNSRSLFSA